MTPQNRVANVTLRLPI